ncbi:MAG: 5-carboxymethyl-2-hydroxymuconate Delta-isomerase [Colwellia sp.]|nr:5-carboxymethyl-2-hydroxymuconate Delta-isomerase [Colwellia sp.]
MPHCIIEFSQELIHDVDITAVMKAVFNGSVQSTLFLSADIKVRAVPFQYFYTQNIDKAKKCQQRFIHVCCKILSGRNLEQRKNLSQKLLKQLTQLELKWVTISVEIVEMELESYNKHVSN